MENVINFLKSTNIEYRLYEHPAVYTCEAAKEFHTNPECMACKNLFLKDKKGDRFFLVVLPVEKRADLKKIADVVGSNKITFANDDELKEKLGLSAGSVSIFGLLNGRDKSVELYIDKEIYNAKMVEFHPNTNTATVELTNEMFHKLLDMMEYKLNLIE